MREKIYKTLQVISTQMTKRKKKSTPLKQSRIIFDVLTNVSATLFRMLSESLSALAHNEGKSNI